MRRKLAIAGNWFLAILVAGLVAFVIRSFFLVPATVAGNSMQPTLKSGDQLLLKKFGQVHRFEIVVFRLANGTTYVKRVIGLPGEHIAYQEGQLYVNDRPVVEPFLKQSQQKTVLTSDFDLKTLTDHDRIPANQYFVLGDNRRISKDSRTFGTIERETIIGRAVGIYWPIEDITYFK
ncbi:MAG: signal peptidase I [Latilactobacillus sakei]